MPSILAPDIKARTAFWHDGERYTALADARPYGNAYRVTVRDGDGRASLLTLDRNRHVQPAR